MAQNSCGKKNYFKATFTFYCEIRHCLISQPFFDPLVFTIQTDKFPFFHINYPFIHHIHHFHFLIKFSTGDILIDCAVNFHFLIQSFQDSSVAGLTDDCGLCQRLLVNTKPTRTIILTLCLLSNYPHCQQIHIAISSSKDFTNHNVLEHFFHTMAVSNWGLLLENQIILMTDFCIFNKVISEKTIFDASLPLFMHFHIYNHGNIQLLHQA